MFAPHCCALLDVYTSFWSIWYDCYCCCYCTRPGYSRVCTTKISMGVGAVCVYTAVPGDMRYPLERCTLATGERPVRHRRPFPRPERLNPPRRTVNESASYLTVCIVVPRTRRKQRYNPVRVNNIFVSCCGRNQSVSRERDVFLPPPAYCIHVYIYIRLRACTWSLPRTIERPYTLRQFGRERTCYATVSRLG